MLRAKNLIKIGVEILKASSISNPELDSRLLLEFITNFTREEIFLYDPVINEMQNNSFLNLINRRASYEPLAYIIGQKEFYGLNFIVNNHVLIPRPDTEIIIDEILTHHLIQDELLILDLGTGSGCIIITLLKFLIKSRGVAIDISSKALEIAKKNALIHNVDSRINFIHADWKNSISWNQFDLIVSNPPYISKAEYDTLGPNVKNFEPKLALIAAKNGLEAYDLIANVALKLLKPKGMIIVEHGYNQSDNVRQIFYKKGFACKNIVKDLTKTQRAGVYIKCNKGI